MAEQEPTGIVHAPARTIFDIHADILAMERLVEYNGGEMNDEMEIQLSELHLEAREKVVGVCAWFKKLDMEIAGIKLHLDEVRERKEKVENLKERLRRWIFKASKMADIIRGNETDGWEGDKIETAQIKLSWRRSEATHLDEAAPEFADVVKNFPHLFDFKIRPKDEDGARVLCELIEAGVLEAKGAEFRIEEAKDYMKRTGLKINGVKTEKRINPQIK
jgi:hypothetical protein